MIREFSADEFWFLLQSVRWTALLAMLAFLGGGTGGLLVAVARVAPFRPTRIGAAVLIKILQGLPLLILLFLVYFGANLFGIRTDAWLAAVIGLTLYASVFLGEIWRGCIEAVPAGQWDAASALALGFGQRLRLVIGPQAARIAIAPTVGFMVQLLKSTSLASILGFTELTRAAQLVNNATFRPLIVFSIVAGLYFALCWPLSLLSLWVERRLRRRGPAGQARA
ncbi:MAG: amino acid ABC transporter permease [Hyphomicrobiales bacterium]